MSYPAYSCADSPGEELAEELVQKVSGTLSVIGSSYIIADVVKRLRLGRGANAAGGADAYQRIMLGTSFFDLSHSIFDSCMGTWMTPKESGWLMASGNEATCTAQGFFETLGFFGSFGYQIALSLNILFLIVFRWSQKKFAEKIEIPLHICIISVALAFAIVPLPLDGYNADCGQCHFAALYDGSGNVIRGSKKLQKIYWRFFWAYLIIMLVFCTVAMIWVYNSVRKQEKRMVRYAVGGATDEHYRESKRIRKILMLYTLALWVCWGIPQTAMFVAIQLDAWMKVPFAIRLIAEALIPLVGFFNMLVYFLPKCLKRQQKNPGSWLVTSYFHLLFGCSPSTACFSRCCSNAGGARREDKGGVDSSSVRNTSPLQSDQNLDGSAGDEVLDSVTNFSTYNVCPTKKKETAEVQQDVVDSM